MSFTIVCRFSQIVLAVSMLSVAAHASVISIPVTSFPGGSPVLDFSALSSGTEVNGLTVGGVTFGYSVGGSPLSGAVQIDGGPGITNNVNPPNIVSVGNNSGILSVTLPSESIAFGYGYAILAGVTVANATTISLFDGLTPVGSLSYTGNPDPSFTGGFAGIQSTVQFNRVLLTFNSTAASAFAVDNVRYLAAAATTTPEPGTVWLLLGGVSATLFGTRRFKPKQTRI